MENFGKILKNTPIKHMYETLSYYVKSCKLGGKECFTLFQQEDGEDAFQHKSKRYRLVKMEIFRPIKRSKIRFNLHNVLAIFHSPIMGANLCQFYVGLFTASGK